MVQWNVFFPQKKTHTNSIKAHTKSKLLILLSSAQDTCTAGSNQTNLLSRGGTSRDRGGVTNVLMITSSVRMLDGIHGHTTHLRPVVTLHSELMEIVSGLENWLVCASSPGYNTNKHAAS